MNLAILGSTGSIGTQTLDVVSNYLKDKINVVALTANKNIDLLYQQVKDFQPKYVCITDEKAFDDFEFDGVKKFNLLEDIAKLDDVDSLLVSVVGIAGLKATVEGLKSGKKIYLANKETLVAGGEYIKKNDWIKNIIPIDSEHSAIFQTLVGEDKETVKRIIITASGGALRDWKLKDLENATVKDVLKHPVWSMGSKVTIDSATMANKGLEIMEAYYLFGIKDIFPIIHRQSIVHSMVEYIDGSIKAQMGIPDMRLPILYALTYPKRNKSSYSLDFSKLMTLTFEPMDFKRYPSLKLAFHVLEEKGILPCVYNAANEIAVRKFSKGEIKFLDIYKIIENAVLSIKNLKNPSFEDILNADIIARKMANEVIL